ncbi:MAG: rRNA pseudouridine synthase [Erysipelotrichaceae bacterium]|nr:rRNA pseudouridine synthase [Erysipelotrichaceae bacterium]
MRLDKFLKDTGYGSRKEVKILIKQKRVSVNDIIVNNEGLSVDENNDVIKVDNEQVIYIKYVYIMLNKPQGVVSATFDNVHTTVIDLINDFKYLELFPVGRLDIDTEGLLLITNDGVLSHNLLSPKKHVDKTYFLETDRELTSEDMNTIENGVLIDGQLTLPAKIEKVSNCSYHLTIHEGKFHQVKRMVASTGKCVIYLKRISFGPLNLDDTLKLGSYRLLTEEEINLLKNNK